MPTIKASYEAVFIFTLSQGEENVTALKEKFGALIEKQNLGVDAVAGATVDCEAIAGGVMTAFSHKTS